MRNLPVQSAYAEPLHITQIVLVLVRSSSSSLTLRTIARYLLLNSCRSAELTAGSYVPLEDWHSKTDVAPVVNLGMAG